MSQVPIFIANWKMHKGPKETRHFIEALKPHVKPHHRIAIAPAFPLIPIACEEAEGSSIEIGGQTLSERREGAYTGEVSGLMLKEVGATFVLVGHSERRTLFDESDALVRDKLKMALACGLLPVLCVGETLQERERGETESVIERQLMAALDGIANPIDLIVAYEPVWAIGTGKVATPEIAQKSHLCCRNRLKEIFGEAHGGQIPLLYGGSVKPDNCAQLLAEPDIDGALIGGASLDVHSFIQMIQI